MRHEFYGDRKDVWKWSVILDLAYPDKRVLYVVMLRPNRNEGHGLDRTPADGARPEVGKFFETERLRIEAGEERNISRVRRLYPNMQVLLNDYEHRNRAQYFQQAARELKSRSCSNYVVFLDPDNGIAGKRPKGEHVCPEQVGELWSEMKAGDTLVVYQHQFRDREWVAKRRECLARELSVGEADILSRVFGPVCFYAVAKIEVAVPTST